LPLTDAGNIVQGNACRLDWEEVCPKNENDETYILGNPPYLGARMQSDSQKKDMAIVFEGLKGFNNLDYISCWFKKASKFILDINAHFAFVTTNSISQGEQVSLLWPEILSKGLEISFAYKSFKWENNAKGNAGVTVAIIGVSNRSNKKKLIYTNNIAQITERINPFLVSGKTTYVTKRGVSLSDLPEMNFGSMANDGGNLLLNPTERDAIISKDDKSLKFIKKLIGALEFIRGVEKYCLWIEDKDKDEAMSIVSISERVEATKLSREQSKRIATQKLAKTPHQFGEMRYQKSNSIIFPSVSSERRQYVPIGFLDDSYVIVAPNFAIYGANPYHLS